MISDGRVPSAFTITLSGDAFAWSFGRAVTPAIRVAVPTRRASADVSAPSAALLLTGARAAPSGPAGAIGAVPVATAAVFGTTATSAVQVTIRAAVTSVGAVSGLIAPAGC